MPAQIICIGNELLTGLVENSNSGYLSRRLWSLGVNVRAVWVIGDTVDAIKEALHRALRESDLVIITGGLGPTDDDLTRETVADILGKPLQLNPDWLDKMQDMFAARGLPMPANNRKQAMIIKGAQMLENKRGTAPGLLLEHNSKVIVLLPGPPNEMQLMFEEEVVPYLLDKRPNKEILIRTIKCIGLGESMLEETIKKLGRWDLPPISYVARGFEVDLQIKGYGEPESAEAMLAEADKRISTILGDYIFGRDDDTLLNVVARLLKDNKKSLALAESCSGGLLADMITDIPGSSFYFKGGMVAYSNYAKSCLLGIDPEVLAREGEVSEATATAMAEKTRLLFQSDIGLGITGIAGPESDRSRKKVGLVFIALADEAGTQCHELNLGGGRRIIKERSAQAALNLLRKKLLIEN